MTLQSKGIPTIRNGNQAIAFMKGKEVSKHFQGYMDNASLRTWYEEDPNNNHLGLMSFWNQQDREKKPTSLFDELMTSKSVIEVSGQEGRFTYSIPIKERKGVYTETDMSAQDVPGIDGSIFYITLNREFAPGTVLTYDDFDGQQIVVSEEEDVLPTGTGYKHPVVLNTQNKSDFFDSALLGRGIEYFEVGHGVSEYGTKFAQVQMPDAPGSMKFEFRLGSAIGVESYVTAKAASASMADGIITAGTKEYMNKVKQEMDSNGYGEFAVRMDLDSNGAPLRETANIGLTMEHLTEKYLHKLLGTKLMFQSAGEIKTTNGVLRFNEGLWKQARRGRIIEYGKPGGITRQHIREAAEYVFRTKPDMQFENRRVKFKCGMEAFYNVLEIFKEEVNAQVSNLAALLGADRVLSSNPVSGDLRNLKLEAVRFTDVYIAQIGQVEIEHDPSLDFGLRGDRFERGMQPHGRSHTTHTMVIWDVTNQSYSNNMSEIPQGANLVEGGNANSSMFLVKPEGSLIHSGRSTGRYDSRRSSDIMATSKYMGEEYFAWAAGLDVWMPDPSKIVMIELKPQARKGFQ